jgi:hypothetical protein
MISRLFLFAALVVPLTLQAAPAPASAQGDAATAQPGPAQPHAAKPAPAKPAPAKPAPAGHAGRRAAPADTGQITVMLKAAPGTALDRTARALVAQEMGDPARAQSALLLIGTATLGGTRDSQVLFVQAQSPEECGSAGCSTSAYIARGGTWARVLDSVSGRVVADARRTKGMRDLLVGDGQRYVWNGTHYANAAPAPPVDLKPRRAGRH